VEIKNINSFRYVQMAIEYEIARQSECLTRKEPIVQETRLFDIQGRCTRAMRLKESAQDYRYFPEPDLPEIYLKDDLLRTWCAELPETPAQKRTRYQQSLGLSLYDARVLTEDDGISDFFELALSRCEDAKAVANWTMNEVLRYTKEVPIANLNIKGEHLGELVNLLNKGTIHGKTAKDIFARMLAEGGSPEQFVPSHDITYSEADLVKIVAETLEEHAEIKARYLAGKTNVLGFLIGVVMEKTQKQPHPKTISQLLREALEKSSSE
jgi:aspartyl-tRNA(Asn)/glutamyl-tRNA(Gln) amidotransferase subunit B